MSTITSSFDDNIVDMLHSRGILQDRLPGDVVKLPHSFYDIKIKVNDYVLAETIGYICWHTPSYLQTIYQTNR